MLMGHVCSEIAAALHALAGVLALQAVVDDAGVGHARAASPSGDAVHAAGGGGGGPLRHCAAAHRQQHLPGDAARAQAVRSLARFAVQLFPGCLGHVHFVTCSFCSHP